jgi:transposase
MAGMKGRKKRFWSDEEKRSICEQTLAPGVSVAQVARRYSMTSNLIFKWLKDPRFAPGLDETAEEADDGGLFLPVEIAGPAIDHELEIARTAASTASTTALLAQRVGITLSDGWRIVVEGPTALSAVVGLMQGLMA